MLLIKGRLSVRTADSIAGEDAERSESHAVTVWIRVQTLPDAKAG